MQELLANIGLLIIGGAIAVPIISLFTKLPTRRDPALGRNNQDPDKGRIQ